MAISAQTWNTADLVRKDKHLLHSLSNLHYLKEHGPLVIARGEGVHIWDTDGNKYIDGFAGLWCINAGHGRVELGRAMLEQVEDLAFVPTFFGLASPSFCKSSVIMPNVKLVWANIL